MSRANQNLKIFLYIFAFIGLVGLSVYLTKKSTSSDTGESTPSTSLAPPLLETSEVPLTESNEQNFSGVLTAQVSEDTNGMPDGLILTFADAFFTISEQIYPAAQLSGVTAKDLQILDGTWISPKQFKIRFTTSLEPAMQISLTVAELPLGAGRKLLVEKNLSAIDLIMPELKIIYALAKARSGQELNLALGLNYPIDAAQLRGIIALSSSEVSGEEPLKTLELRAERTKNHYDLSFALNKIPTVPVLLNLEGIVNFQGKQIQASAKQEIPLEEDLPLTLGQPMPAEGGDGFSLTVPCHYKAPDRKLRTTCRIDPSSAKISIVPTLEVKVVPGPGYFRILGDFLANQSYEVIVQPGLRANGVAILKEKQVYSVQLPAFKPTFRFKGKARYFPASFPASLQYESRNIDRVMVEISQVFPQNIHQWLAQGHEMPDANLAEMVSTFPLNLERKTHGSDYGEIDLAGAQLKGNGIFVVRVYHYEEGQKDQKGSFQDFASVVHTNLSAIAKADGKDLHIWSRALQDLGALPGVEVQAYSLANRMLGSCTTGSDGNCAMKGVMNQPHKPEWLLLKTSDDLTYLSFRELLINIDRFQAGMRPYKDVEQQIDGFLYFSRGVYRPGEIIQASAVLRSMEQQPVRATAIRWLLKNPRGKIIREQSDDSSPQGLSSMEFPLQRQFSTGLYTVEAWVGEKMVASKGINVEEFVPERIRLEAAAAAPQFDSSQANFNLSAHYLFGPPVSEGAYQVLCDLLPGFDRIPGAEDYFVSLPALHKATSSGMEPLNGTLDAAGTGSFTCDLTSQMDPHKISRAQALVEVKESGSERVTIKRAEALLARDRRVLGLRPGPAGTNTIALQAKLFDLSGKALAEDVEIEVSLFRKESDWIYSYNQDYGYYSWNEEQYEIQQDVAEKIKLSGGTANVSLKTAENWGDYIVRARVLGANLISEMPTALGYRSYGSYSGYIGDTTPKPTTPEQLNIAIEKSEMQAGESFNISFESPFPGYALVTTEAENLMSSTFIKVEPGRREVKLRVPRVLPNFYVSVLLLKTPLLGQTYLPARAYGMRSLNVIPEEHRFKTELKMPATMRPGNNLEITLAADHTEPTEYTIAVVDEGILQLTDFKTPDPEKHFFEPRRLDSKTLESMGWTYATGEKSQVGGDQSGLGNTRGRVIPVRIVSHFSGRLSSENGKIVHSVPIPAFQGRLRIMVLGVSGQRLSMAEGFVTVADPLVMQATLPRFLAQDDQFRFPVLLANTTTKPLKVTLKVTTNEAVTLTHDEDREQSYEVAANESHTAYISGRAIGLAGQASFRLTATYGQDETKDEVHVPLLPSTPSVSSFVTSKQEGSIALTSLLPEYFSTDNVEMEFAVSGLPYLDSLSRGKHLIAYPYGCVEQTSSATFPLVYIPKLLPWVAPDLANPELVRDMAQKGIQRLLSMQTGSGGFAYWPGQDEPMFWPSIFVTNLLLDATKEGYAIPQKTLDDSLQYLHRQISRSTQDKNIKQGEPFAHFVLAKAQKPHRKRLAEYLQEKHDHGSLGLENDFLIMLTLEIIGDQQLLSSWKKKRSQDQGLFVLASLGQREHSQSFWSATRTNAMRLALGEDVFPQDSRLEGLAASVAASLGAAGQHFSTQELAWAIAGLGKRLQGMDMEAGKQNQLILNGTTLDPYAHINQLPVWQTSGNITDKSIEISSPNEKKPILYVKARGFAKDRNSVRRSSSLMSLQRNFYRLDGQPAKLENVSLGERLIVELVLVNNTQMTLENLAIVDYLPAGFEIENPRLGRAAATNFLSENSFAPDFMDMRDDQIQIFGNLPAEQKNTAPKSFFYMVRAVTAGTYYGGPATMELMYEPQEMAMTEAVQVTVQ